MSDMTGHTEANWKMVRDAYHGQYGEALSAELMRVGADLLEGVLSGNAIADRLRSHALAALSTEQEPHDEAKHLAMVNDMDIVPTEVEGAGRLSLPRMHFVLGALKGIRASCIKSLFEEKSQWDGALLDAIGEFAALVRTTAPAQPTPALVAACDIVDRLLAEISGREALVLISKRQLEILKSVLYPLAAPAQSEERMKELGITEEDMYAGALTGVDADGEPTYNPAAQFERRVEQRGFVAGEVLRDKSDGKPRWSKDERVAQSESPQDDGALVWASFYEGKVMKRDMAGGPSVWWNRASAESASPSGTAVGLSPTAYPQDTALRDALKPFAKFACDPECEGPCNNCKARTALEATGGTE